MVLGIMLVLFGVVVWVLNFTGNGWQWARDWPFIVLLIGIYQISKYFRRTKRTNDRKLKKILSDVEKGKLRAEEALEKMEEDDE
ncbi:hypothetical protein J7J69_06280 [candidate division WOR-3 bacterium]|nr:hypothetical protein [candidate division WOR-3 bacterium]